MIHNAHVIRFIEACYWCAAGEFRWMAVAFYSQWHADELKRSGGVA